MENNTRNKITVKSVAAAVVAALAVLIFLSASIFNHNLPAVTAAMPSRGHLNQVELTTGIVRYADTIEVSAETAGIVTAILVQEGERVYAGQPMFELDFRGADDEIRRRIEDAEANFSGQLDNIRVSRSRHQVELERTASNIRNVQRQIDELRQETDRPDSVSDFELRQTESEIVRAEHDLQTVRQLTEAGIAALQELRDAENSLAVLQERLAHQQRQYNENSERNRETLANSVENRERQIRGLEHQLETLHQDTRTRNLDLEALTIQEESARRERDRAISDYQIRLDDFSQNAVLAAPADGVVTLVAVNQGRHVNANQQLAALGRNLVVEAEIPLSNTFVTVGSEAVLHNPTQTLNGTVTAVKPHEHAKRLLIELSDYAESGETFTIQFEARSAESFILVPNSAVNRDGDGYFLNQVRRRQGILGTEFYTERLRVYIGDSDTDNTAIIRGITFFEPVALASTRPFSESETIRLRNEGDFFES